MRDNAVSTAFMSDRILPRITPLILTYNEEANIRRTLARLVWAHRIVIVDSGSTDSTIEIAREFANVEIVHRAFDSFAAQWNFAIAQVRSEWVLSLDADYELSDGFIAEISELSNPDAGIAGFSAGFVYRVYGRPLRGTLYPPRVVLFRLAGAWFADAGHTQRLAIKGAVKSARGVIYHDDRKPLSRWIASQQRYAEAEAKYLVSTPAENLPRSARIRRLGWVAPLVVLPYTLLMKGCIFDGWAGWFYGFQRMIAETMIALQIVDQRLKQRHAAKGCAV